MVLDDVDDLEFEAAGGSLADGLGVVFEGASPYTGTLPFAFELHCYQVVVDDDFVVQVKRPGSGMLVDVRSPLGFARDVAIGRALHEVLGIELIDDLAAITEAVADIGYRFIATPTGAHRGLTEKLLLLADPISELDAAVQLCAEPDYIYALLDGGADAMRHHVKFGKPYHAALNKAQCGFPGYWGVVEYMRACGAY